MNQVARSAEAVSSKVCNQSKIMTLRSYLDKGLPRSRSISLQDRLFLEVAAAAEDAEEAEDFFDVDVTPS